MKNPVPDLLKLAGVHSSDKAAAAWLSDAIVGAGQNFATARARPLSADHNALLADIRKALKSCGVESRWSAPGTGIFGVETEARIASSARSGDREETSAH